MRPALPLVPRLYPPQRLVSSDRPGKVPPIRQMAAARRIVDIFAPCSGLVVPPHSYTLLLSEFQNLLQKYRSVKPLSHQQFLPIPLIPGYFNFILHDIGIFQPFVIDV
jgi:hypothetical protein